jgi:hypothetical protein
MSSTLRSLTFGALLFLFLTAASGSASAQQLTARQLKPAFDLTKVQMPVEILSIKLKGKEIKPGEKIMGDDDWLLGLSFTLKNISDKPIAYLEMGLHFTHSRGFVIYYLNYGVDYSRGTPRRAYSPPAIEPGGTLDLVMTKAKYQNFQRILAQTGASPNFDTAPYLIERICFEYEPDIIWEGGYLKRRDPSQIAKFNLIERYVLPDKQK